MSEPVDHINDPGGHFPYKADAARAAGLPAEQVDLSQRLVEAQQRTLENPGDQAAIDEYSALMREAQRRTEQRRRDLNNAQQAADQAAQQASLNGGGGDVAAQ